MKKIVKSLKSILLSEGVINFAKRKFNDKKLTRPKWFAISFKGKKIKIYLDPQNGYVDKFIYKNGIYEESELNIIFENLKNDSVFVDIGANIGQYSLIMSNFCNKVFAFEPLKQLSSQIQKSIEKNNYKNIELIRCGLGSEESEIEINVDELEKGHSTLLSHLEEIDYLRQKTKKIVREKIKIITLDSICKDKKVDFIKMDIEGFEYYAFLGALETIKKNKPYFLLEFCHVFYENHQIGLTKTFFNLIKELGYNIRSIERDCMVDRYEDIDFNRMYENFFLFQNNR